MSKIANHIYMAIVKHTAWKKRLHEAVQTGKNFSNLGLEQCELGKWLITNAEELKEYDHYYLVVDYHGQLHQEADKIIELAQQGHQQRALSSLEYGSHFEHISQQLVQNIIAWHDTVVGKEK